MKRITLFAGHYGSGKTNIALNYARWLKQNISATDHCSPITDHSIPKVAIADLDIVNPYFRTKDSKDALAADGIELVVSEFANSNVDFPALPKEIYSLVAQENDTPFSTSTSNLQPYVVIDVGGDDRGALALGRYVDDIRASNDYEMLGVINFSRPLTRTPEDAVEVLREIEYACKLPFTGLVNNTNLGQESSAANVLESMALAKRTAELMNIPLRFTCVPRSLEPELRGKIENLFALDIQKLYYQLEA